MALKILLNLSSMKVLLLVLSCFYCEAFFGTNTLRTKAPTKTKPAEPQQFQCEDKELFTASIRKLFKKLCNDHILGDVSMGRCCYNACPGCDFINDYGEYNILQFSGEGRWIATYQSRSYGSKVQTSTWSDLLFNEGSRICTKDDFIQKLLVVENRISHFDIFSCSDAIITKESQSGISNVQGSLIPSIEDSTDTEYDEIAATVLWNIITKNDNEQGSVTKADISKCFRFWKENEATDFKLDGIGLKTFENKLTNR